MNDTFAVLYTLTHRQIKTRFKRISTLDRNNNISQFYHKKRWPNTNLTKYHMVRNSQIFKENDANQNQDSWLPKTYEAIKICNGIS